PKYAYHLANSVQTAKLRTNGSSISVHRISTQTTGHLDTTRHARVNFAISSVDFSGSFDCHCHYIHAVIGLGLQQYCSTAVVRSVAFWLPFQAVQMLEIGRGARSRMAQNTGLTF
ncbi:unnamed protein product, partial [Ectocarpus fasciculatus]